MVIPRENIYGTVGGEKWPPILSHRVCIFKEKGGGKCGWFQKYIFNNIYNTILVSIKPTPISAKVTYERAFERDFIVMLRYRRYDTLSP